MHFVKAKGILSAKNRMNLYRGCSHGCIYCDSRSITASIWKKLLHYHTREVKKSVIFASMQ